ncbi:hypothetical protein H5410_035353 [Solanum commersonii]|uniref:Uncharacterized protein n=1 Tax=Solanum commersonii TaxID=4109 RepID=A0A9J5Y103_SOLCO|nr:hypothetical protein H5410_035353 [Solanum commersonii]
MDDHLQPSIAQDTHESCGNGFNLGGAGKKMPERIMAKDLLNNIVESIADDLSKQSSILKQKSADHATWEFFFNVLTTMFPHLDP